MKNFDMQFYAQLGVYYMECVPPWDTELVNYSLDYLASKISAETKKGIPPFTKFARQGRGDVMKFYLSTIMKMFLDFGPKQTIKSRRRELISILSAGRKKFIGIGKQNPENIKWYYVLETKGRILPEDMVSLCERQKEEK